MTTYRIRHSRDYFCLSRHAAQDVSISLRARGLHHLLLSFPDDWEINEKHIVKMAGIEKREAVRKAMKELMDAGYVVRSQQRNSGKFSKAAYDIFELPHPTVAQESDHGKTGDGGIGDGGIGDGNPNDIQSIDPQSIDQNKVSIAITTTERPKKKKSSSRSGAKEKASLLEGETLDRESAALVNEMLSAYPMLVEEFGIALTSKMVTACHGRSHLDLQAAVLALYQQAETGRLRDPQLYLEDAIAKGWLPSKYWVENGAALTGWTIPQRILDYIESRRPAEEIALLGVPA